MQTTVTGKKFTMTADAKEMAVIDQALQMYISEMKRCGYTGLEEGAEKVKADMIPEVSK